MKRALQIAAIAHLFRAHSKRSHGSKAGSMAGTRKCVASFMDDVLAAVNIELTKAEVERMKGNQ